MIVIGLTGSIAMGKSEVARIFREEHIPVFDADHEVHQLYDSSKGVEMLGHIVPEAIIGNTVDRNLLSQSISAKPTLLQQVEKPVHAEIARRRAIFLEKASADGHGIIVVDIPLLFEKVGQAGIDVTLVVSAPREEQRMRALARPGMTEEKLDMILKRQMPDFEKRQRANHVIVNDGSLENLRDNTLAVLKAIRKLHSL